MHDYKQYASRLSPIEEKDLILFDMSPEEKAHAVKQYNRALMNSLRDGTDVAQIMLKPLIAKYPSWGDPALLFGICLAKEEQFARAESAFEFAVNATLGSGNNLTVAQEAIKAVREDEDYAPQARDSQEQQELDIAGSRGRQAFRQKRNAGSYPRKGIQQDPRFPDGYRQGKKRRHDEVCFCRRRDAR